MKKSNAHTKTWWVLEGDWGGQTYATIPTHLTKLTYDELIVLLQTIDSKEWKCNKGDGAWLSEIPGKTGDYWAGGCGGGWLMEDLWISSDIKPSLQKLIRKTIKGG